MIGYSNLLLLSLSPIGKTIFGIAFIFFCTTLGAAVVFVLRNKLSDNFNRIFLGFAAGVMIAAAVWGLLLPALDDTTNPNIPAWIPPTVGFIFGAAFLLLLDVILPHLHINDDQPEGLKSKLNKTTMLVLAIALHNAPEGLAVGLAFGYALKQGDPALMTTALGLAIGIGLQNFPEGAAVAIPLKESGVSTKKAFAIGSLSGLVEPVMAGVGMLLAEKLNSIMPWFLGFAAGAMIYVVVEELIPEAQLDSHKHLGTLSFIAGFLIMMILDGIL